MCGIKWEMQWLRLRDNTQMKVYWPACRDSFVRFRAEGAKHEVIFTGEQWMELLGVLFQASQSSDASQRENAFRIFTTTPGIIEKQHEDTVLVAFTKGFKDDDISVREFLFFVGE